MDLREAVTEAVSLATRAPSVHNTQPWRFRIGADRVECFADFSRQLPVLDPTRRQLYLSCGAALHHLTVALRAAGYASEVRLAPDADGPAAGQGAAPAPIATVLVTAGPPASAGDVALAAAINERHTQREPFADRKVDHSSLTALRHAAETQGAWLAILDSREDQITLAVLLNHADQAELSNPDYQRELHNWRRTEPATDGIPTSALPEPAIRHTEVPVRDFTAGDPHPGQPPATTSSPPPDERPALLILGTDADSPTQWIHAGQALSALLLQATTQGLRASMLGQVIDLPTTRGQLRTLLRLIGEPQMVLRIGYGPAAPATPRRPLTDVLS